MERIEKKQDVVGGRAKIKDTRIPVWQIIINLKNGRSREEILKQKPAISIEEIHACEAYYKENPAEIEYDIAENTADE